MTNIVRCLAAVAAATCMALLAAPVSAAAPRCTNVSPQTTQCQTNGSTQIVTSPPPISYGPWYGWGIGLGGFAIVG